MAILAIVLHREVAFIILALVPLTDGLTSPIQSIVKTKTGKGLFKMAPIHHHFELLGWPEAKVVFRFWLIGILCLFLGIFVALL